MNYYPIIEELISSGPNVSESLIFLLSIPIILTVINFARYLIGMKSMSFYGAIATIFLFYSIGSTLTYSNESNFLTGSLYGTALIILNLFVIIGAHIILKKVQLHFYPKTALILISSLLMTFFVMSLASRVSNQVIIQMDPLNIILLMIISEQLLTIYIKKGVNGTITTFVQSTITSIFCYLLLSFAFFGELLLKLPWIALLPLPLNFLIGKYTGLRITEFIRFHDILIDKVPNNENIPTPKQ